MRTRFVPLPIPSSVACDDHDDLTASVRRLALFVGIDDDELGRFVAGCDVTSAQPGQVVQAQDEPVRWWHVVLSGHAVVQRDGTPLGLLTSGDSWSEHTLLNGLRSSIEVVALSPLTLLTLDRRRFFTVPEQHPVLAGRLVSRSAASPDRLALPMFNALAAFDQADPA
jgi:CRP-like cAMP-binding protein